MVLAGEKSDPRRARASVLLNLNNILKLEGTQSDQVIVEVKKRGNEANRSKWITGFQSQKSVLFVEGLCSLEAKECTIRYPTRSESKTRVK